MRLRTSIQHIVTLASATLLLYLAYTLLPSERSPLSSRPINQQSISSQSNQHSVVSHSSSFFVLLVGDSLTAGFVRRSDGGVDWHPYQQQLQASLEQEFPNIDFQINNIAQSGACLVARCHDLHKSIFTMAMEAIESQSYSVAVILATTNDLSCQFLIYDVLTVYMRMLSEFNKRDIPFVLITVPAMGEDDSFMDRLSAAELSRHCDSSPQASQQHLIKQHKGARNDYSPLQQNESRRHYLNRHLNLYCAAHSAQCQLVDLNDEQCSLNLHNMNRYYSDAIHFNEAGYDILGKLVVAKVKEFIADRQA